MPCLKQFRLLLDELTLDIRTFLFQSAPNFVLTFSFSGILLQVTGVSCHCYWFCWGESREEEEEEEKRGEWSDRRWRKGRPGRVFKYFHPFLSTLPSFEKKTQKFGPKGAQTDALNDGFSAVWSLLLGQQAKLQKVRKHGANIFHLEHNISQLFKVRILRYISNSLFAQQYSVGHI